MRVTILYLAAGNSRRFGENKLLYPLDGKAVYRHLLDRLAQIAGRHENWELLVVTQYERILEELAPLVKAGRLQTVFSPDSEKGISYTIRAGIEAAEKQNADACACFVADQIPDVDVVIVPIGGGGLISGVAFAIKELNPNVKVYGVQASGAPSMLKSIDDGKIEKLDSVSTIADGIAVKEPGDITFAMCQKYVDGIVTVSDDEIAAAILALIEQQKLITEGAGAVSVAAAMFNKVDVKGKKVCCLLSGGNIDVTILSRVIKRGLLKSGRTYSLTIELLDKPGQLKGVADIIAKEGGNVISIHHERASEGSDINGCYLRIVLETKNFDHIAQIKKALTDAGFIIKSY